MGFERAASFNALQANNGDLEAAINYLLTKKNSGNDIENNARNMLEICTICCVYTTPPL
jgi:hypothetical protein